MNRLKRALFYSIGGCLCYSLVSCISFSLESKFSLPQIIFFQEFIALILLVPYMIRQKQSFKTPHFRTHLIRDLAALFAAFFWLMSLKSLHLVNAAVLQFTSPFYVPYLAWAWYRDPIPRGIWKAMAIGFIGVAIILRPNAAIIHEGALWGILTGLTSAVGLTALRQLTLKGESAIRMMFYLFLTGSVLTFPFAIANWVVPSGSEWTFLILLGVCFLLNNILLTLSFRHASASYLAPISYIAVLFNGYFGWLFFQKAIDKPTIVGSILIVIGTSLIFFLKDKREVATNG